MEVKTFRAKNMQEALLQVRQELGPMAAILQTREVRTSRLFGLIRGQAQVEVVASRDVNVPSRFSQPVQTPSPASQPVAQPEPQPVSSSGDGLLDSLPGTSHSYSSWQTPTMDLSTLWNPAENAQTHAAFHFTPDHFAADHFTSEAQPARQETVPAPMRDALLRIYADLIEADLDDNIAHSLLERLRNAAGALGISGNFGATDIDGAMLRNKLTGIVESDLRVSGPIQLAKDRCRVVALVGPTGVGKTTTIAKLAAHYKLGKKCRVGLITLDTFRIAAVEQLKIYSDIINAPMAVVSSPREIRDAVRRMTDFDLILMDTTGRSQGDDMRIHELRSYLQEAGADEIHLVLSSTARSRVLQQTAERFSVVGTTSLIITKLDEAAGLGNLLPLAQASQLPISYVTNGQNVPEDIEIASVPRLARWILGQDAPAAAEISSRELQIMRNV